MRRSRAFALLGAVAVLASCMSVAANEEDEPSVGASSSSVTTGAIQLNLLYVHGVKNDDASRINAANSLADLKSSIEADIPTWISNYQAAHPGVTINVASAAANLYMAPASPYYPTDSLGPTHMDDWEVGDPGCATTKQGDPCTTAYEWRYRLVQEINRLFPSTAKNIILIGHSTGARVAFEVASNTGPAGVGAYDWGVQNKIAAVVSIQGMIDGLQPRKYNVVGAFDFVTTCKKGDAIAHFGNASAPGNGWCEYAGNISGVAAADWVALDGATKQVIAFYAGDRSASRARELWRRIPQVYRDHATFYTDGLAAYKTVLPSERHQVCAKSSGHTNMIERFNCALRQRVSRLAPGALSFSKMIKNHIGAIKYFICHYNKVIIGLAESALHL